MMKDTPFRFIYRFVAVTATLFRTVAGVAVFATVAMGADVTMDAVSSTGTWTDVAVAGGNDHWIVPTDVTNYTWSGAVAQSGRYQVSVFIPAGAASATNGRIPEVIYTVVATDGSHRVSVNQKTNANKWCILGTYDFSANSTAQLHLSPNNFQIGAAALWESSDWGTNQLWVSNQAPKLTRLADSTLAKPLRRLLVISANTAIKQDNAYPYNWYCQYHGQAAAPAMATLKAWARSKNYALTEAYDAGWSYLDSLALYDAVLINYEPPTFNDAQFKALKDYVQLGGGLAGTHSSINLDWRIAWMFGADFNSSYTHPYANYAGGTDPALMLTLTVKGMTHPSTGGILRAANPNNPKYGAYDEWYCWNNTGDVAHGDPLLVESNGVLAAKFPSYYANPHTVCWQRDSVWWQTADPSTSTDPGLGRVWYSSMGHDGWYHFPGNPLANYALDPVANFTPTPPALGSGKFSIYEHLTGGIIYAMGESAQISILPQLQTLPTDCSVTVGKRGTFSVAATGTAKISYQWQRLINGVWTNITQGGTSANYTSSLTKLADNGAQFRVAITNKFADSQGNSAKTVIYSDPVTLTVTPVPPIPAVPLIIAAVGGSQQIVVTWGAATDASTYTVKSSQAAAGPFVSVISNLTTTSYTHTGLGDGITLYYVVTASNATGDSAASLVASAKTYTGLENWRLTYFGGISATGNGADAADPDGDGVANLMEYALGTDPTLAQSASPPTVAVVAGKLTLSFFRARADVTYDVKSSSDLVTWTTIATNPGTVGNTVVVTDTASLATRRFLCLRVTAP